MDIQEYIESGILELYVYGALTAAESEEVSKVLKQYPEVEQEVEQIEAALQQLATAAAPYNPEEMLAAIKAKLQNKDGVVQRSEFGGPPEHFDQFDRNKDGVIDLSEAPTGPPPSR